MMKKLVFPILLLAIGVSSLLYFISQSHGGGNLDVKITNTPIVMPAVYKVYGNKDALNGKYYLFKMLITNTGGKTMNNVRVEYNIPGYIDWTELDKIAYLYPGQSSAIVCYPKFKDNIVDKNTPSSEKANIRITYTDRGSKEINESFGFKMEGRNEFAYTSIPSSELSSWNDIFDNTDLLPCFVTPNDPIVKYFTQQIQEKVLKGEAASVWNTPKECVRFLMGVYEATRMAHMVYSGTSGVPEKFEDVSSTVQRIRLPREVITGKTGLCIELTLMYASILENAGLHAIIFLVPQHAFPGFELDGQYYAIESTGIGGEGIGGIESAAEAFKSGEKKLYAALEKIREGYQGYKIIDVNQLNHEGAIPMEMKDDEYLRKKVDEIAQSFEKTEKPKRQNDIQYASVNRTNNEVRASLASYNGSANFTYPSLWNRLDNPNPQFPVLECVMMSPDRLASANVYRFPTIRNAEEALNYLQQAFYSNGMQIQYSYFGSRGGYQVYRGQTTSSSGTYQWLGVMKPSSSGMTAVIVGAYSQAYNQYQNILNSIINTVR